MVKGSPCHLGSDEKVVSFAALSHACILSADYNQGDTCLRRGWLGMQHSEGFTVGLIAVRLLLNISQKRFSGKGRHCNGTGRAP